MATPFLPSDKMRAVLVDPNGVPYTASGGGGGGVSSVSGVAPIASSGGATPAISLNDTAVAVFFLVGKALHDRFQRG